MIDHRGYVDFKAEREANRVNWNERTPVHAKSDFWIYERGNFMNGGITLNEIEMGELRPNNMSLEGKTLLHLQCHFGLDTMSWARLGMKATGVDISDESINLAQSYHVSYAPDLDVSFIRSDIYDLPSVLNEQFDYVYVGIGSLIWLPNLARWAAIAASYLKPGGILYVIDIHPMLLAFDRQSTLIPELFERHPFLFLKNSYFKGIQPEHRKGGYKSYAGEETIESSCYMWQHSIGEIVSSVANTGLDLQHLHEFPLSIFKAMPCMIQDDKGWWRLPVHNDSVPQTFSLKAVKTRRTECV